MTILVLISKIVLVGAILVLTAYAFRHHWFVLYRMSLRKSRDAMELVGFTNPSVSILVPMHNEQAVAADVLQALVDCDYDWDKLEILAIDDRSEDRTGAIIDEFAAKYPIIKAIHRNNGNGGKAGALTAACEQARGEILLLFDADYIPGRAMIRFLIAPFCDPEVGAVMGRVVPHNGGASLLAGLLELERSAGYQIGQQARFNLGLTPQFGGTVGGVRASVLKAVGGWNSRSLTEDTDLTFRIILHGWRVAYVNRAECHEEAPETWQVRRRQIKRWATGHTECLHVFWRKWIMGKRTNMKEKVDGLFVLACYLTAPVLVLGWFASLVLFFAPQGRIPVEFLVALAFVGYQLFGNQATFLELGSGALLDSNRRRALLLPLNLFNFFASTGAICSALGGFYLGRLSGTSNGHWDKTKRFRGENGNIYRNGNGKTHSNGNGNGHTNGNGNGYTNGNGAAHPNGKKENASEVLMLRAQNGLYFFNPEAKLN